MDASVRKRTEEIEQMTLSPRACLAQNSRGRQAPEDECPIRTVFQRDRDRILHCNAFRRLKHKTQVFLSPEGDHYRTRLTHTLEVSQIARTIARALRLNEDLTEGSRSGTTSATRRSVTRVSVRLTRCLTAASAIMSKVCAWLISSKRTARGLI